IMSFRGDSERQALLRDKLIKETRKTQKSRYVSKILSVLKPQMKVLDIGCGTAHIIQELAISDASSLFIGLDISPAMLKMSHDNTANLHNIGLVEGDGHRLPFPDYSFDIVITRLANYSPQEAYRVLRRQGCFVEYSLGPEAGREIQEFFPERIEKENFFFPKSFENWKQEVCEDALEAGFLVSSIEDYKENEYYENEDALMDLIEMVPLVMNFDRKKDRKKIRELAEKYGRKNGIKTTWHYYILTARTS
ncbi:MAG: methyltransferase domain-containing protein, partial [Candidatus Bathyarchaeota archaeon]